MTRKKAFNRLQTNAPAAVGPSKRGARIGMADLLSHEISWICGVVYVGNGTLGATDGVYFRAIDNGAGSPVLIGNVPIAGGDTYVGATYISDVEKHYARKKVRKQWIELKALQPATTNAMEVFVAPVKGATGLIDTAVSTGTTAALAINKVLSMVDYVAATSWEDALLDLTKYIGGGYGKDQNEFVIDNPTSSTGANIFGGSGENIIPSCFAVSGNCSTTTLRGQNTHYIIVHQIVDYLDYIGANAADEPIGTPYQRPNILARIAKTRQYMKLMDDELNRDIDSKVVGLTPSLISKVARVTVTGLDVPTPPLLKLSRASAAGSDICLVDTVDQNHFDEKERQISPKRSSSLSRLVGVGTKR